MSDAVAKPVKTNVTTPLDDHVKTKLERLAAYERRNLGAQLQFLIDELVVPLLDERLAKYEA